MCNINHAFKTTFKFPFEEKHRYIFQIMLRDLNKILQLFAVEDIMDYCNEFDGVKSILEYCHHNAKPFDKLTFGSGNESIINLLVHRLENFFVKQQLVDATNFEPLPSAFDKMRKITMFLFLTTECSYIYNLDDNQQISHLLNLCPKLPKFLLVTLAWDLKLNQFFFDTLSYAPIWFSYQHIAVASEHLKFINDPFVLIKQTAALLQCMMTAITHAQMHNDQVLELKRIFCKLHETALMTLCNFYAPNMNKVEKLRKSRQKIFRGFVMKHNIEMALHAFDLYEKTEQAMQQQEQQQFYNKIFNEIDESNGPTAAKRQPSVETIKELVAKQQMELLRLMLNSTQNVATLVSLDDFVEWAEEDMPDKRTLQQTVGQLCWLLRERIQNNEQLQHGVLNELEVFAQRPLTLEERVSQAQLGDILNNLENVEDMHEKCAWFNAIFNWKIAFGNEECLQSIKHNIQLISVQQCQQLMDFVKLEMKRRFEEEYEENASSIDFQQFCLGIREDFTDITDILLLSLEQLDIVNLLQLLEYQLQLFGDSSCIFKCSVEFDQRCTSFFNKTCNEFDLKNFLHFCFEDAAKSWQIFLEQALHWQQHINNYCQALKEMESIGKRYFKRHLQQLEKNDAYYDNKLLPVFLSQVFFCLNYQEQQEFLKQHLSMRITNLLETQNFGNLLVYMHLLEMIAKHGTTTNYKPQNFGEFTSPTLMLAAHILNYARWNIMSYTETRALLVENCINFIESQKKTFLPKASQIQRDWLMNKCKNLSPCTKFYFQKFALKPGEVGKDFDVYLSEADRPEVACNAHIFLLKTFPRVILKEADWLARKANLLPYFSQVMLDFARAVAESKSINATNNFRHCVVTYMYVVDKFLIPACEQNNTKLLSLVLTLLEIISKVPEEIYEESFLKLENSILKILNAHISLPVQESELQPVLNAVQLMKECTAKEILEGKLKSIAKT